MARTLNRLVDKVTWEILLALKQRPNGLRFNEICRAVDATEPVISDRLKILKKYDLVRVTVGFDDRTERNYFIHVITPKASNILKKYSLKQLLNELEKLEKH